MPKKVDDEWLPDARGRYRRKVGWWITKTGKRKQYLFSFGEHKDQAEARLARVTELWAEVVTKHDEPSEQVGVPPRRSESDSGTVDPAWTSEDLWIAKELAAGRDQIPVGVMIHEGDRKDARQLLPLVYDELRRLAAHRIAREAPEQTLQATALVHEAYLRVVGDRESRAFKDSGHFFAAAATAMRRILIDRARSRRSEKRGGERHRISLGDFAFTPPDTELLALDEALQRLAEKDPLKARLVELRYFAGLTGDQAAEVLGISPSTADRHWAFARAWLQTEVRGE